MWGSVTGGERQHKWWLTTGNSSSVILTLSWVSCAICSFSSWVFAPLSPAPVLPVFFNSSCCLRIIVLYWQSRSWWQKHMTHFYIYAQNCIIHTRHTYPGAHHPERPSTLYLWSNLCPDWAIFRHVFPANFCLHCGSYMTELNVEKNGNQSKVSHPSSVFLNHFCSFLCWFRPYMYADCSRDGRSRET